MKQKVVEFFELVKFEHTVFALPFAYLGMIVPMGGRVSWPVFGWVTLCMVTARTAGMIFNRLADLKIDAQNPRTRNRPLVTGKFHKGWAILIAACCVALLLIGAAQLNPLCLKLSPLALIFLTGYHYAKRFSFFSHWILGAVLASAPLGGWIAATGSFSWPALLLALSVLLWVAGFDILYSIQDVEFDRANKLHSVPVRFGVPMALRISSICHVATAGTFILFGLSAGLGWVYGVGVAVCVILLRIEHSLINEDDFSKLNAAFFNVNGWIGILLFIFTWMDLYR